MSKLYKFSPIKSEEELSEIFEYIISELEKLSVKLFDQKLPITTLKVFPHYPKEYDYLYELVSQMGEPASFNSNTSYYSKVTKQINGYNIKYIGVRIVDPYRLHVGCGDYEIEDFEEFKREYIGSFQFIRELNDDMLEIWHPDFDVLGYIIPAE